MSGPERALLSTDSNTAESSPQAPPPLPWARKLVIFVPIAVLVCALDLATKAWIDARLPWEERRVESVIGDTVLLANHHNTGGMWGVGSGWDPWVLRSVRFFAVLVIFWILKQAGAGDRLAIAALGAVMGGAAGNLHDSLALGHVRDFLVVDLDFGPFDPFPTFNVADSAICCGVALLALQMLRTPKPEAPRVATAGDRGSNESRTS